MTRSTLAFVVCAASVLFFAIAASTARSRGGEEPEGPIHDQMERVEKGLKKLRRDLKDPATNVSSLALVLEMQDALQQCKVLEPPLTAKKPEAERPAFVADYRKALIAVQKDMLDLELALLDGDNAKAQELYKKIHDAEDPGHEKFTDEG